MAVAVHELVADAVDRAGAQRAEVALVAGNLGVHPQPVSQLKRGFLGEGAKHDLMRFRELLSENVQCPTNESQGLPSTRTRD